LTSFGPNERPIARLRQELGFYESPEQFITYGPIQAPQALCLGWRQSKAGHFSEFPPDSLKHVVDTHGISPYRRLDTLIA
jgi:hypothetical protein